jgi:WD40 repeat protein/DNA-binding SARP family transcriptional activator/tRNA A-37 threonylcarbamoyl transferase component Bud32
MRIGRKKGLPVSAEPSYRSPMEFRVLGPLEVSDGKGEVRLGGPKQRLVLAHLLLRANRVVATDRLIEDIWGEEPPEAARSTLHAYVSRLRKLLGSSRIEARPPGYVFRASPEEVDALGFEAIVSEARRSLSTDPAGAVALLRKALGLWRGSALADLAGDSALHPEITRLEQLRLAAIEDRIEAEQALGHSEELTPELEVLVFEYPLRERLWGQLMVALYRSGRQGEALAAYQRAREVLGEELGIDPSLELRQVHERVLRQDPALDLAGRPLRGYQLLEQIGEGAFGTVYRASQPQVGREVAVKAIHRHLANDPEFIRRFEAEAQLVARLEHPHIVPLYDYWREPDAAYLVMRYLRGGSLRDRLAKGSLTAEEAAGVLDQLVEALDVAHRAGVVHRDVKPSNILLDEEGNAYLGDFGVAKDVPLSPQEASAEDLSPSYYLSPEQVRGDTLTPAADIYSLGMVLHEALAAQHPVTSASAVGVRQPHDRVTLPSIREVRPDLPESVDQVFQKATAADQTDRYADAPALAAAFRHALGEAPARAGPSLAGVEVRNPYKGLRPFLEADAADFFGRDRVTAALLDRMADAGEGSRLLAVVGPSGSGKSSLVRAGLVPALRSGALAGSESWFVLEMIPGAHPLEELEAALLRIAVNPPASLIEQLERDEFGLIQATKRVLPADESELLLVIDQFEEVFTLVQDEARRDHFLSSLLAAVSDPRSRLRVVITLRADFYDRPLLYKGFGDLLARRTYAITPLSTEEVERAIAGPAERLAVKLEPRLVAEMVAEVVDQPGGLPLLQYALTELFERRSDSQITIEAYHKIGGVLGALARRAEELYGSLDEAGQGACRQLFLRLITLGDEGSEDTRRRVLRTELASVEVEPEAMEQVIDALGNARLLSFDRDPATRGPTVEVAHEALLREWGRLRGWVEAAREDVRTHRRLATAAADWAGADRDASFLLRGSRLQHLESWAGATGLALTSSERLYLQKSVARREAEAAAEETRQAKEARLERRSVIRLRALVAVLAVLALVASSLTLVALDQRGRARQQSRIAFARELAAAAAANVVDPDRSILLAMQAVRTYRSAGVPVARDAVEALHGAVQSSRVVMTLVHPSSSNVSWSPDGSLIATGGTFLGHAQNDVVVWDPRRGERLRTLTGHAGDINDVNFSPDGSRLVSAGADGTVIVWNPRTGRRLLMLPAAVAEVAAAFFSPDGSRIATTDFEGGLQIWDASTGDLLWETVEEGSLCGMAWSPDGTRVAVGACYEATTASVWDVNTGRRVLTLRGHSDIVPGVAFSPDGRRIATESFDGTAGIWDASNGRRLLTLRGHSGSVFGGWFSPDGSILATHGSDGTARIWDVETGSQLMVLAGHLGPLGDVAWSPDGTRILTGGADGAARIWDVTAQGSREVFTLAGHTDQVRSVQYSPDGGRILTSSLDGTAMVWDASSGSEVRRFTDRTIGGEAVFSPDGSRVVTSGPPPILWDTFSGRKIRTFRFSPAPNFVSPSAAFAPEGRFIAIGGSNGYTILWDESTGRPARSFSHAGALVWGVAFSPDGSLVGGASEDRAEIWNLRSGLSVATLEGHESEVRSIDFSPDGKLVVTGSGDGTAKVWDVPSGRLRLTLRGHSAFLWDARFSPDGKLIATAGEDNTARLWDASTGQAILKLTGHTFGLTAVAFSPDGSHLATASGDGTVRVYVLRLDQLMKLAAERVTRGLTNEECRVYLHVARCPGS